MKHSTLIIIFLTVFGVYAFAQQPTNKVSVKNSYHSQIDKQITVRKVGVLPATDNVNGLYARHLENKLNELLKNTHRFDQVEVKDANAQNSIEDYEGQPELIKKLGIKNNAEAFVAGRVLKQKKGLDITLDLYLVSDGQLFVQELVANEPIMQTKELEQKTTEMFNKLINKIPYKGLVLSRQGNRVTIDIGARDGIRNNTVVSVEQVISLKRHPKFNFLLSTEKEIMGKIKIIKADETLSFGIILSEKDQGVIAPESKVTGLDFITYADPTAEMFRPTPHGELGQDNVSFGKNPREWLPPKQPTLGKIGLGLGLGSLRSSTSIQNTITNEQKSYSGDAPIYPQIDLAAEIWLTSNWYMSGLIRQGVFSVPNPEAGGAPSRLAANNAHYDLHGGYKFLLQDNFWGPQINLHAGFAKYSMFVDASTPLTFTSTSYSGMYLGLGGSLPITNDHAWYLDINLDRFLYPNVTETPVSSGATSDTTITAFSFGGSYKLAPQYGLHAHLNFEFYSSTYSGAGNRGNGIIGLNSSQSLTTLITGIDYMF
ncbi:MAG: hypothetical protein SGI74_03195 [Oligoflexia bacterium]|nr:hypothetical protein [Oligoflexia bacterium]